jgi:hypothetical protein
MQGDMHHQAYPMSINNEHRPTNRLGCSRAFHNNNANNNWGGNNSLPRTNEEGQYSCKATSSSSTSLNIINSKGGASSMAHSFI